MVLAEIIFCGWEATSQTSGILQNVQVCGWEGSCTFDEVEKISFLVSFANVNPSTDSLLD